MARYHVETLAAARLLLARRSGQKGRLSGARTRRGVSTAYYALFHFLLDEATRGIVGAKDGLLKRRRVVSRSFSHAGMRQALSRIQQPELSAILQTFFGQVEVPPFALSMSEAFVRALEQRHEADYDLNASLSEADALLLVDEIETAISDWQAATDPADADFKDALCLLLLLKGDLRGR